MRELLLCAPDYYGIEYEINPWMSRARGAKTDLAKAQWQGLHKTLYLPRGESRAGAATTETARHGVYCQRRAHRRPEIYS